MLKYRCPLGVVVALLTLTGCPHHVRSFDVYLTLTEGAGLRVGVGGCDAETALQEGEHLQLIVGTSLEVAAGRGQRFRSSEQLNGMAVLQPDEFDALRRAVTEPDAQLIVRFSTIRSGESASQSQEGVAGAAVARLLDSGSGSQLNGKETDGPPDDLCAVR